MTTPDPDWYLKDWLAYFGKKQAALVNELGWDKSKASYVVNGKHPYRRSIVNELAAWLDLAPYELLMPPAEAMHLRQLRDAAVAIAATMPMAAENGRPYRQNTPLAKGGRR